MAFLWNRTLILFRSKEVDLPLMGTPEHYIPLKISFGTVKQTLNEYDNVTSEIVCGHFLIWLAVLTGTSLYVKFI